jgi:hypothetical protein
MSWWKTCAEMRDCDCRIGTVRRAAIECTDGVGSEYKDFSPVPPLQMTVIRMTRSTRGWRLQPQSRALSLGAKRLHGIHTRGPCRGHRRRNHCRSKNYNR